jgi:antitoxin component YwqK of YwqJK toxin-antitoxin module
MKTVIFLLPFFLLFSLTVSLCPAQQSLNKITLWSGCVDEKTVCVQIHLEGSFGERSNIDVETNSPTILQGDDATIGVEVKNSSAVSDGEYLESGLQPIDVTLLASQTIIEKDKVSKSKLKELIGDKNVIERLLDKRELDTLAITILRQDFEVKVNRIKGQTLVDEVISLQVAFADEIKEERPDYPGCTVPEFAKYDGDEKTIRYTVPTEKMVFRNKSGLYNRASYWVGPYITYFDEERQRMRTRSCFNEYSELDGKFTHWYKNGRKKAEKEYKDGKYHGAQTEWYESGQMETEIHYKDGEKSGSFTEWFEDGHKRYVELYANGKLDGLSSYWGSSKPGGDKRSGFRGMKTRDCFYSNGQIQKKIFYSVYDATKHIERTYRNGKQHGLEIYYRSTGGLAFTTPYVNGKRHGTQINYDSKGRVCSKDYYVNDEAIRYESLRNCRD